LRTMLCFKCGGIGRMLIFVFDFLCCSNNKKKFYVWSFELLLVYENVSIIYVN
jgi:hypothetical protein